MSPGFPYRGKLGRVRSRAKGMMAQAAPVAYQPSFGKNFVERAVRFVRLPFVLKIL
jgi:hypothetical protein